MLSSAGYEARRGPEAYRWEGRKRGQTEFGLIQLTLAGEGRLEYEGQAHTLKPGDAMALYFPHDHCYWRPRQTEWRFLYICLHGSEAMRLWREAIAQKGPVWPLDQKHPLCQAVVDLCTQAIAGQIGDALTASRAAYGLATHGMAYAWGGGGSPTRPESIRQAIRFAQNHHTRLEIGVAELADAAGLSRFHFSRLFRQTEGISPGDSLRRLRMATAVRLIQTTEKPFKLIAAEAGFRDANYLSQVIAKAYGVTPTQMRRRDRYEPLPLLEESPPALSTAKT